MILSFLDVEKPKQKINYYFYPDRKTKTKLMGDDGYAQAIYEDFSIQVLVKKYGKKKLLKLISLLDTAKNKNSFSKLFKKIYSFTPNYKNFNTLLRINKII